MTPPDHPDPKGALRAAIRERLATLTPSERDLESTKVLERLFASSEWKKAETLLLYFPAKDEIDLQLALKAALEHRKRLTFPRFNPATQGYEAAEIGNLSSDIVIGRFGIREPSSLCPVIPMNALDFIAVPGLAFDGLGRRLGRGRGFYDRLLTGLHGFTAGIGFDFQLVKSVPAEAHDVVLNSVLTPSGWLKLKPPGFLNEPFS